MKRLFAALLLMIVVSSFGFAQTKGKRASRTAPAKRPAVSVEQLLWDTKHPRRKIHEYNHREDKQQ